MNQYRFVNENGLMALKLLAQEQPKLFIEADTDALVSAMETRVETTNLWSGPLDLRSDLSALNEIEEGGPGTDGFYARLVRTALGHLPPSMGHDEHRWATINCFVIPRYSSVRWSNAQPSDESRLPNFVRRHWLEGHMVNARQDNSIARLWWLCEFSSRAAQHTAMLSEDEILDAMADNVNLYHQFLARPILLSRSRLVATIYEMFMDNDADNEYLSSTRYASELFSSLNFMAAEVSLDFMNMTELREAVEEAKPPKEQ